MQVKDYQRLHKNYSITQLELYGLAINMVSFAHFLKRVDFNAILDHLVLTQLIKIKAEPATNSIKIVRGGTFIFIQPTL